jgi:hypothetical protein
VNPTKGVCHSPDKLDKCVNEVIFRKKRRKQLLTY